MDIKSKVFIIENPANKMVGGASITIDDSFVVKGLKIFEGSKGYFVAMPNRKNVKGEFVDIAFPITAEAREQITNSILEEYEKKLNEQPQEEISDDLPF